MADDMFDITFPASKTLIHKMKFVLTLLVTLIPLTVWADQSQMNIVILYADDLGYGDLGCFNPQSKIPTPHLDRLAASGMRFTDAHSSSGICTPSRYALLTGRHHWRDFHGIDSGFDKPFFRPGQLTLAKMLQEKGYDTACIGKWHLGWDWESIRKPGAPAKGKSHLDFDWSKPLKGGPLARGFDSYFGDNVINFPPYAWIENEKLLDIPDITFKTTPQATKEGDWECREGPGRSDWDFYKVLPTLTKRGVDFIRDRKGKNKPFFLYFPFPSPHAPIVPNDAFDGKSKAGPYGDFVHQTDDACGQLLTALDEAGLTENTMIIFSADNGAEFYAYARDEKYAHWSCAPLRGLKQDIFEGGHRVPTIMRWPGLIKAGTVCDGLFSQTDVIATIADHLDYDLPADSAHDSFNFFPWLAGKEKQTPRTTMVHNTFKDKYAIRHDGWCLVDAPTGAERPAPVAWMKTHNTPENAPGKFCLYNMKEDIGQRNNLAQKFPEKAKELQALLRQIRSGNSTAPRLASSSK